VSNAVVPAAVVDVGKADEDMVDTPGAVDAERGAEVEIKVVEDKEDDKGKTVVVAEALVVIEGTIETGVVGGDGEDAEEGEEDAPLLAVEEMDEVPRELTEDKEVCVLTPKEVVDALDALDEVPNVEDAREDAEELTEAVDETKDEEPCRVVENVEVNSGEETEDVEGKKEELVELIGD